MSKAFVSNLLNISNIFPRKDDQIHPYAVFYSLAMLVNMHEAVRNAVVGNSCTKEEVDQAVNSAIVFFQNMNLDSSAICERVIELKAEALNRNYPGAFLERLNRFARSGSVIPLFVCLTNSFPKDDPIFTLCALSQQEAEPQASSTTTTQKNPDVFRQIIDDITRIKQETSTHSDEEYASVDPFWEFDDQPEEKCPVVNKKAKQFRDILSALNKEIYGQENAVLEFVRGYFEGAMSRSNSGRHLPMATFLFAGPPGVGKTMLAEKAAEVLHFPSLTIHMSEYADEKSYLELVGVSTKFRGGDEGPLLRFVRENPFSVLIFDEIEKAHPTTINQFLQILDSGSMMNYYTQKEQSFRDTIIIFTSNACSSIYSHNHGRISTTPKNVILSALQTETKPGTNQLYFPREICSRLASGSLILFDHLDVGVITRMIEQSFRESAKEQEKIWECPITFDPVLPRMFLFHLGGTADARIASRKGKQFLTGEFFELLRQIPDHPELTENLKNIHLEMDLENNRKEIRQLFQNSGEAVGIAVCSEESQNALKNIPEIDFRFASTVEELMTLADDPADFILIDPRFGMSNPSGNVSLDDQDSVGVNCLLAITEDWEQIPIYLLETGSPIPDADVNSFRRKGAVGIISELEGNQEQKLCELAQNLYMKKQFEALSKRGYVLNFRSSQLREGETLIIRFYGFTLQQAMDAESAGIFLSDEERPTEKLSDVIGAENAKEEIRYFIRYLSNPQKFMREGGKPAKGMLLYGPPGTGKTMLARAMAGECKASFIQLNAAQLLSQYSGHGESSVRSLFARAKRYAPSVIFIDEIDAIGKARSGVFPAQESILNALLTEIDGFHTDNRNPVFVLAATNYGIDSQRDQLFLDAALLRRFDNRIYVDLPNAEERETFLKKMVTGERFQEISERTIHNIAERTPGLSLAILQNIIGLAFRNAARQDRSVVDEDLMNALEEYSYGEKKNWGEAYCRQTAIHEAGHAYLSCLLDKVPSYVTIESRGSYGGYTLRPEENDTPVLSREALLNQIRISLAGRAAEQVLLGEEASLNTGASSDLEIATRYASQIICSFGMLPGNLVAVPFEKLLQTPLAASIMEQVQKILNEQMEKTLEEIRGGLNTVKRISDALLEKNHLLGDQLRALL